MKLPSMKSLLRGVAMSALLNGVMPVAEAWAAEQVQVLRKSASAQMAAVPFTTFQQEQLAVTQSLPCKWISKDGRLGPSYGNARYDFLCKGGDFATVSLYMDKADAAGSGVGKVRLLYRDWAPGANPNAGEALIAQQYLQHVAGRFVPASIAANVMDAFWGQKKAAWDEGGVSVKFVVEKAGDFYVRKLEIGAGSRVPVAQGVSVGTVPAETGLTKAPQAVPQTEVYVVGPKGEKLVPGRVTPSDAGLMKPSVAAPIPAQEPAVVVPAPGALLPVPGVGGVKASSGLVVPSNAPASVPAAIPGTAAPLQPASPAELNTAPAPESRMTPDAPPELSSTLVPSTEDIRPGSRRAPSNFDAYNQAMELTKDIEEKAQVSKVEEAKVTASKTVTPSTVNVPPLQPVPTPGVTGEGLTKPQPVPDVEEVGQPQNYNGPRSSAVRPLPQLKFVPKAEPVKTPDEVIKFEDEGSQL